MNADVPFADDRAVSHLVDRISHAVRESMVSAAPRRLVAERDGKHHFIAQADIHSIEADRNYVDIRVGEEVFRLRWTMLQAQGTLDPSMFLRVHRSVIVNLHQIREMERGLHGQYLITLTNGRRYASGRAYRRHIQAHLKNSR